VDRPVVVGLDVGSTTVKAVVVDPATRQILWHDYKRHHTKQADCVLEFMVRIGRELGDLPRDLCGCFAPVRARVRCASRSARSSCKR